MLEEQRESWGTRGGFILAAVGSAVGLGNLWGFPYKLYSYGGGAFLIPYIAAMLVVGLPLMILEFSLGHYTQRAAPGAFGRVNKRLEVVGWWGIILGFVIVMYYPVILAYCVSFLWYSIRGLFNGGVLPWAGEGQAGVEKARDFFFNTYLGYRQGIGLGAVRWNIVAGLVISWLAMYLCIFKGVKLVGRIVWLTVPIPWLMLLVLTVRGLTLEGSMQGLVYYLNPVWSQLARPVTWRYAFGQVFFSLSLAFGVMITYASFLHRKSDLNNNAAIISLADFATSFVAGLAVFATLGAMSYATQLAGDPVPVEKVAATGPSLAFVAFPYALAQLPYSAWFSFIFFFALITLGIDSAFSITESVLASIVDKTGWKRDIVLPVISIVGLVSGLVFVTEGGINWLGTIDGFVNGTWGIALLGLLECLALGWLWKIDILRRHANSRSDWRLGRWWDYLVRWVIPLILGTLFFWQLFDDLAGGGILKGPDGQLLAANCVGLAVVAAAPLVALLLGLVRGRDRSDAPGGYLTLPVEGRWAGAAALAIALLAAAVCFIGVTGRVFSWILWPAAAAAFVAAVAADRLLGRCADGPLRASWLAGMAGATGTMTASCCMAYGLYALTGEIVADGHFAPARHSLGGVSYIILAAAFLIIVGGLGWCFYRAVLAAGAAEAEQMPEEIGDEQVDRA